MDARIIRKFLHRNYAFGVSASTMLDSYLLGNEMRYLNHAKNPNCTAKCEMILLLSGFVDNDLNSCVCEWRSTDWDLYMYVS